VFVFVKHCDEIFLIRYLDLLPLGGKPVPSRIWDICPSQRPRGPVEVAQPIRAVNSFCYMWFGSSCGLLGHPRFNRQLGVRGNAELFPEDLIPGLKNV
jgi:hypothetical protein